MKMVFFGTTATWLNDYYTLPGLTSKNPPSMSMIWPLIYPPATGEARSSAAPAISSSLARNKLDLLHFMREYLRSSSTRRVRLESFADHIRRVLPERLALMVRHLRWERSWCDRVDAYWLLFQSEFGAEQTCEVVCGGFGHIIGELQWNRTMSESVNNKRILACI